MKLKLKFTPVDGIGRRRAPSFVSILQSRGKSSSYRLMLCYSSCGIRLFNCGSDSVRSQFSGENAYDILGVSETSSSDEIKASFRKLAKETHPDLAESRNDSAASQRFVQILAAYEILSDLGKRAHYDSFLIAQRKLIQKRTSYSSISHVYKSDQASYKHMEVVEWLKFYRLFINEILAEKKIVVGTDYFHVLERDFYLAMHIAFYGPTIESMELLPDCFEAEERSTCETPEILHLVSGRDLFGMVCFADEVLKLPSATRGKPISSTSRFLDTRIIENSGSCLKFTRVEEFELPQASMYYASDAYKDLELHICGKVIARASRVPPNYLCEAMEDKDNQDQIHVFLSSDDECMHTSEGGSMDFSSGDVPVPRNPLGTIVGLGTSGEEESCFVYNKCGTQTHVIMKHRTLMVKHMHWYNTGENVSVCECRCSRARLPPSKFWLFEPRCGQHDIGGWYVETFGKNKKGRTVPSQRFWDGFDAREQCQERLHPAMYIIALAYRTLDIEDARMRKQRIRSTIKGQLFRFLNWSKKLF